MYKKFLIFSSLLIAAAFMINFFSLKNTAAAMAKAAPEIVLDSSLQACIDQFDAYLKNNLTEDFTPGAAFAIVKDSFTIYQKGFGLRDIDKTDSVDVHTVFRLASLSKGFAGVLTGLLVKDSILNWDDKVLDYVPDLELKNQEHAQAITIRHLLSHTTGLPRHTYSNLLNMGVDYPTIKSMLKEVDIAHPAGTYYNYQNVLFSVIAEVVEEATGKSYETLVREYIFEPLEMKNASASFEGINNGMNVAMPHTIRDSMPRRMALKDKYYSVLPASGINASVSDMAGWLLFLLGNEPAIADSNALSEVFKPQVDMHRRERGIRNWHHLDDAFYALGWRVLDYRGHRIIYHGGYVNGYRSEIAFIPSEKIGAVFLSNGPSQLSFDCIPHFVDLYLDSL